MYIDREYEQITLKQIELMAHALGFERKRIKYNKYAAYRNYFTTTPSGKDFKELGKLVDMGLMRDSLISNDGVTIAGISYHVTEKGKKLLGKLFSCSITEID